MFIAAVAGSAVARAHFVLVSPDSWKSQGLYGDPQKLGPCGEEGGTLTGKLTEYRPGDTVEVTIDEKIHHPGHYRVVLAVNDRSELPPPPVVTAVGQDPCGSVDIQDPPVFPVLADNMLPHTEPFDGPRTFSVTLPSDVTCTACTLQVIEYMSNHGQPCFYYHCADISILADQATPTATPVPVTTNTPSATATTQLPVSCAGDCDSGGSVTVNEIVMLVGIALERMPIDLCEMGNSDGNEQITINELLAAVNRALSGCGPAPPTVHPQH